MKNNPRKQWRSYPTITFQPSAEVAKILAVVLKDKPKGETARLINEALLRHLATVAKDMAVIDEVAHRLLLKARLKASR